MSIPITSRDRPCLCTHVQFDKQFYHSGGRSSPPLLTAPRWSWRIIVYVEYHNWTTLENFYDLNTVMSYCTVLRKPRLSPIVHWRSFIVSCRSETSGLKQSAALIWIYRYAWLKIFLSITHILHCTRTKDVLFNVFHNRRTQHPSGCHSRCEACVYTLECSLLLHPNINLTWCLNTPILSPGCKCNVISFVHGYAHWTCETVSGAVWLW